MKELSNGKALEPSSIDKLTPAERFALETEFCRSIVKPISSNEIQADAYYRSLGYTKHPDHCLHERKKFTASAMRWRCMECGAWVT